jgi:hypothetical protein
LPQPEGGGDRSAELTGTPRAGVLELIQQMGGDEDVPTSQEPFAGFTRLGEGSAAA